MNAEKRLDRMDAMIAQISARALATEMAIASADRVLASMDRLEAVGADIDAVLADYRGIDRTLVVAK